MKNKIKVSAEVSGRHIHLAKEELEVLFGVGFELSSLKALSQEGEFAASEKITIATPKDKIELVRVLGPLRKKTQVEISKTDAVKLGLNPPLRESNDLKDTSGITLTGPKGNLELKEGVIIAQRHLHSSPTDAVKYNLKDKQIVSVKFKGERSVTFHNVVVRVAPNFVWKLHLDTDEANASGLLGGEEVEVII